MTREAFASIGGDGEVAPELLRYGPKVAGPANDVYGFARVLAACGVSGDLVSRGISAHPEDRPTMQELARDLILRC